MIITVNETSKFLRHSNPHGNDKTTDVISVPEVRGDKFATVEIII